MQILNEAGEPVATGTLAFDDEQRLCGRIDLGAGVAFDLPPVQASFEKHPDGLLFHVLLPGSGLNEANILIEPSDMKTLKDVPGKGLVGFVLKAFR